MAFITLTYSVNLVRTESTWVQPFLIRVCDNQFQPGLQVRTRLKAVQAFVVTFSYRCTDWDIDTCMTSNEPNFEPNNMASENGDIVMENDDREMEDDDRVEEDDDSGRG